MDLQFFPTAELSSNHQTATNGNQNIENSYRILQSNQSYNGCFLFDPKELGPKIERPSAPFTYNINKYKFSPIRNPSIFSNHLYQQD